MDFRCRLVRLGNSFTAPGSSYPWRTVGPHACCLTTASFVRYCGNSAVAIVAGKCSLESCLCVCLMALAMVMAGTGDLEVLRLVKCLRDRVGPINASVGSAKYRHYA